MAKVRRLIWRVSLTQAWIECVKGMERMSLVKEGAKHHMYFPNHRQANAFARRILLARYGADYEKFAIGCGVLITPVENRVVYSVNGLDYELDDRPQHIMFGGTTIAEVRAKNVQIDKHNRDVAKGTFTGYYKDGGNQLIGLNFSETHTRVLKVKGGMHDVIFKFADDDAHKKHDATNAWMKAMGYAGHMDKYGGIVFRMPKNR